MLPVLPALLSASATGGRRRPLGIVLGLAVTFTVTIVGLATVVDGVGLGDSLLRDLAIVALALFGLAVAIPRLGDRLEAPLSRLARFGPRAAGAASGPASWSAARWGSSTRRAPGRCSPPSSRVSAASGRTVVIGLAYALGSSLVLLVLALAGRRLTVRLRGPALSRALGTVMVLTAVALAFQLDIRFQTAIAEPSARRAREPDERVGDVRGGVGAAGEAAARVALHAGQRTPTSRTSARRRTSPATTAGSTASR